MLVRLTVLAGLFAIATGAAAQDLRASLYLWDTEEGTIELAVSEPEEDRLHVGSPNWSPDGKTLLFDAVRIPDDLSDNVAWSKGAMFAVDVSDGGIGEVRKLGDGSTPCFSPDGSQIAYSVGLPGDTHVMDADGGNDRRVGDGSYPQWAVDAETGESAGWLLVQFGGFVPTSLAKLDVESGKRTPLNVLGGRAVGYRPHLVSSTMMVGPTRDVTWREYEIARFTIGDRSATIEETLWTLPQTVMGQNVRAVRASDAEGPVDALINFTEGYGTAQSSWGLYRIEPGGTAEEPLSYPLLDSWNGVTITSFARSPDGRYVALTSNLLYADDPDDGPKEPADLIVEE